MDTKLIVLRDRVQMIIDGRLKQQLCDWWLTYIETETNKFLEEQGYCKDCLPDNYMNEAPKNLDAVKENLALIQNLMIVEPTTVSKLDVLVQRVTSEVYAVLDEFIADTEYVLNLKKEEICNDFENKKIALEKDMEYLLKMKAMDDEIQRRRKTGDVTVIGKSEMTDVVPIGGLVMARVHVVECELMTSLEVGHKKTQMLERKYARTLRRQPSQTFESFFDNLRLCQIEPPPELSEYAIATCPSYTPKYCVDIMLRLSESRTIKLHQFQKSSIPNTPRRNLQLGQSRLKGHGSLSPDWGFGD